MLGVRFLKVAVQPSQHGGGRRNQGPLTPEPPRQVDASQESRPQRLGVSLDSGQLPRKEQCVVVLRCERGTQRGRCVEVGVAVDAAVAEELGVAQPRDHAEYPLLLRDAKPGLKSHEVPHLPRPVLAAKLHHSVRLAP